MNQLQLFLSVTALAFSAFTSSLAHAAVTTFNDRANWQAAAGAPQTIDFATTDSGAPITNPASEMFFESLTIKATTFVNIFSFYNQVIYTDNNQVLRVNLPANTSAFGADISPFIDMTGTYTIRLSTGEVFTPRAGMTTAEWDFFGVTSTTPLQWVEFTLDTTALALDNFSFVIAPSVLQAAIDIVPGSQINPVKPGSGDVDVAILSTSTLNAMNVNVSTVRFGAKGTEAAPKKYTYRDVNGDRVKDLVMEFKMKDTGIVCKATTAKLTGKMKDGKQIAGSGSIKTVNCK